MQRSARRSCSAGWNPRIPRLSSTASDPAALRRQLRRYVDEWQELTRSNVTETRSLLGTILRSRIVFTPTTNDRGALMYELTVPMQFDRLLMAAVPSLNRVGGTSPRGNPQLCSPLDVWFPRKA
jgi:hypothetical protein